MTYTHRITLAVPEAFMDQANHLALIMGESSNDISTFTKANWQDSKGNLYAVCSAACKPVVIVTLTKGLPEQLPSHAEATDVVKAQAAYDLLEVYQLGSKATPERIMLAVDDEPLEALAAMGLSSAPPEVTYSPSQKTMTLRIGSENIFTLTPDEPQEELPTASVEVQGSIVQATLRYTLSGYEVDLKGLTEGSTTLIVVRESTGEEIGRLRITVKE